MYKEFSDPIRPSASPAHVEAATVQGQTGVDFEWFKNHIWGSPMPLHWRVGQFAFNELLRFRPDLAEQIRGTELDPFHQDSRLPAFLESLEEKWNQGSKVRTVAAPSDSPSPKSGAVAELVEAAAQVSTLIDEIDWVKRHKFSQRLRSALEVVKTDSAFSHNTDSTD